MADFYGNVAGYHAYCTARDHLHGNHQDDKVAAALIVASEWIDAVYRSGFGGLKVGQRAQLREWPRSGAVDIYLYAISSTTVPLEIENATYEAAHREIENQGSLSTDYTPSKYKRASVDGAVSVEYKTFDSAAEAQTRLVIVDQILAPILTNKPQASSHAGYTIRA